MKYKNNLCEAFVPLWFNAMDFTTKTQRHKETPITLRPPISMKMDLDRGAFSYQLTKGLIPEK
jgi:hypothetical protein